MPPLLESQQYLLYMLLSLVQMNPAQFISDWTIEDSFDINDFLNECMSALLDEDTVTYPLLINIDLFSVSATPLAGVGTLTYNASGALPFGYAISTQNTTLYGIEQPVWLPAGEFDYVGWASLSSTGGNTGVAITDGASVIDTIIASVNQSGAFGTRVKHTGSFTIPESGLYKMVVGNVSASAGNVANWISHHIRQTS